MGPWLQKFIEVDLQKQTEVHRDGRAASKCQAMTTTCTFYPSISSPQEQGDGRGSNQCFPGSHALLPGKIESLLSAPKHGLREEEKNKIIILKGDLQRLIDNYLMEPSEVESPALTANFWMKDVRDLSFDIDDFVDELVHVGGGAARISVVQNRPPRVKISRFWGKQKRRQWIAEEISGFRARVKEAIQRHGDYLGDCKRRSTSSGALDERPSPPLYGEAGSLRLVGMDKSIKRICGWLAKIDGQPGRKVASIVGASGVGKTTLANELYRKLGGQFECRAFVRMSRIPDIRKLLTSILSQVRRQQLPVDASNVHKLVIDIKSYLKDKTYFIVLDDLWAPSTWEIINRALPENSCCGRILTTTEVDVVAQTCCADNSKDMPSEKEDNSKYIFKKEPLSENESRELFSSIVFGNQSKCPQDLKEVSYGIVKRSGSLPLAIIALAGLLARQPADIEHWNYIKNSLSFDLLTNASLEGVRQVLSVAYDSLPHRLKASMLYLSLYEENYVIWKDDLVKQWIAEGFACAMEGNDEEEVAHNYFNELVNRGMIQPVDMNCNDEVLSCTVHYMVLHFIRYKSMEENFSIAIDHSQTGIRLADKVRRLALHFSSVEDASLPVSMRLSQVRSLAFYGLLKCMPSIVEFRFVQVLILQIWVDPDNPSDNLTEPDDLSCKLTEHDPDSLSDNHTEPDDLSCHLTEHDPDGLNDNHTEPGDLSCNLIEIPQLFRLRYLRVDACHMRVELPTQMQRLKDLVAFEIDGQVSAVPSDIVDLRGLLYLSLPSEAPLPTGIGRMTSLRSLGFFDLSTNSTENVMTLGELTNLQDLHLTCSTLQSDNLEKNLGYLGSVIGRLSNLKCLTLLPAVSSHVNTQDGAGASSMSISCHGFNIVPNPQALLQRLELSWRCCIFSSLPDCTENFAKLGTLKIAVRKLSWKCIVTLKGLPALTVLSLYVWTAPVGRIAFDNKGFPVLKYFKFVCATPCVVFLEGAMPRVGKLKLSFNANRIERHSFAAAGFGHLAGLNEITAKIGSAGADESNRRSAESALRDAISKHPSIPIINVKWVDCNSYGDVEEKNIEAQKEMYQTSEKQDQTTEESSNKHGTQEKYFEEDANKHADRRTCMPPPYTSRLQNAVTDGFSKKLEIGSGGYGDVYKENKSHDASSAPKDITFHLLEQITDGFSKEHKVGSGGYGDVYKGVHNGEQIAVKKLHQMPGINEEQFKNECNNLMRVHHKNIVRLVGYCYEVRHTHVLVGGEFVFARMDERALCFEYLQGGSLDQRLSDESSEHDWNTCYKIIKGICEGLHHLHTGSKDGIYHLHLKPPNILLDKDMTPKIGDFGLSTLIPSTETFIGTTEYMPPEYIQKRQITPKFDVFSLGVIIIQIMKGPKGYSERADMSSQEFIKLVHENWGKKLQAMSWQTSLEIKTCIEIALRCVEANRVKRPTITEIVEELKRIDYAKKSPIGQWVHAAGIH